MPPSPKAAVRAQFRAALESAPLDALAAASREISTLLLDRLPPCGYVLSFHALVREVDLVRLNAAMHAQGRLCLPRMDWDARTFVPALLDPAMPIPAQLEPTRHSLLQPTPAAPAIDRSRLAAVLVPGLAFDDRGNRLGRGAGFYDRFLSNPALMAPKIGVAFQLQIADTLPTDPWDARVDVLATERRWIVINPPRS